MASYSEVGKTQKLNLEAISGYRATQGFSHHRKPKGETAFDPKLVWAQGKEEGNTKRSTTTEKEKRNPKRITAGLLYRWRNKVRAVEITHPRQK